MKCTSSASRLPQALDHNLAEVPAVEVVNNGCGTLGLYLLVYFLYNILQGASPVGGEDPDAYLLLAHPVQKGSMLEMYTTMGFSAVKKSMTMLLLV